MASFSSPVAPPASVLDAVAVQKSLAPGFLIAMPQLGDPNFHRSVVLMIEHSDTGAMGLVLNRTAPLTLNCNGVLVAAAESGKIYTVVADSLGLDPLAPPDRERRPKIGEHVPGAELPQRLVEVESDDRKDRQRGDRRPRGRGREWSSSRRASRPAGGARRR